MSDERTFPVEATHILMFARSVNDDNPIYADADKDGKIRTSGNIYVSCTGLIAPGTDTFD